MRIFWSFRFLKEILFRKLKKRANFGDCLPLSLQSQVASEELLYSLRRRMRQITETKKYLSKKEECVTLTCRINCSLTWGTVIKILIELENGRSFGYKTNERKFLTVSELISVANLLKDSTAVSDGEFAFYLPLRLRKHVYSTCYPSTGHSSE